MIWEPKDPSEVVFRAIPWEGPLEGDEIATSDLSVLAGTATLSGVTNTTDSVSATVAGGVDGEAAVFRSLITTLDGRTLEQIVTMVIREAADVATPTGPSTTTKQTLVDMAYEVLTLAGYTFDLAPEEKNSALRALDGLMAEWAGSSLDIGYNFPARLGEGSLADMSGIPDFAVNGVVQHLALRIMPIIGKAMSAETRLSLATSMSAIRAAYAVIPDRRLTRSTPVGAGNKPFSAWSPYARGCR